MYLPSAWQLKQTTLGEFDDESAQLLSSAAAIDLLSVAADPRGMTNNHCIALLMRIS